MDLSLKSFLEKKVSDVKFQSANAVIELAGEGATVPFIARYRKEKTGNLDEVQVRNVLDNYELFQEINKRKAFILKEIHEQGNLTEELKKSIEDSMDLGELEEIYRPFKKKKKTKATIAREAGIEPLANWIWQIGHGELDDKTTIEVKAKEYLNPAAKFATYDQVLKGAQDILVEKISNNPELRDFVRQDFFEKGKVVSKKTKKFKAHSKYENYAEYEETVASLSQIKASHRYLAVRRGWHEGELTVAIKGSDEELQEKFNAFACTKPDSHVAEFLKLCAKVALTVHVIPSISNIVHKDLKDKADDAAISVFAENVRKVLLSSPFGAKCVLGVDPGVRTGCKLALVDKSGEYISSTVLHIQGQEADEKAKKLFSEVLKQITVEAVAVGNGTGGREAEAFIRKIFKELNVDIPVVLVNEAGASVYSASEAARVEFADLDLTVRGAISIARRLMDPLAELVKIDPKSIGVGQYQHDVSQPKLKKSLHNVVESCVNNVGVDVNTASEWLLAYVAGIGPGIAKNVVEFRKKNGLFKNRQQFLEVPHFSSKSFEQAAGFLRIPGGEVPLDNTGVHPERYTAVKEMGKELGLTLSQLMGDNAKSLNEHKEKWIELVGKYTFEDIVKELESPGRDPREKFKPFSFRDDIHEVKDLKDGMICPGIVTNVTNFGAFVDIGVHQDGLVHISELANKFVDDPRKVVSPGDQVKVKVMGVDGEKNQISLSMAWDKPAQPNTDIKKGDRKRPEGRKKGGPGKPKGNNKKFSGKKRPGGKSRGGKGKPQQGGKRPGKPFNNPFAALAEMQIDKDKK